MDAVAIFAVTAPTCGAQHCPGDGSFGTDLWVALAVGVVVVAWVWWKMHRR